MLPPTVKQFFFKLLISIFVHDYKNVLRQYRQAYTTQRQMEQYLRVITPEDLYDKELVRISERMSDLQKLIYQLRGETGACWDSMGVIKQCQDLHFRAGRQD